MDTLPLLYRPQVIAVEYSLTKDLDGDLSFFNSVFKCQYTRANKTIWENYEADFECLQQVHFIDDTFLTSSLTLRHLAHKVPIDFFVRFYDLEFPTETVGETHIKLGANSDPVTYNYNDMSPPLGKTYLSRLFSARCPDTSV